MRFRGVCACALTPMHANHMNICNDDAFQWVFVVSSVIQTFGLLRQKVSWPVVAIDKNSVWENIKIMSASQNHNFRFVYYVWTVRLSSRTKCKALCKWKQIEKFKLIWDECCESIDLKQIGKVVHCETKVTGKEKEKESTKTKRTD